MKILHIVDYIGPHGGLYQILRILEENLGSYGIENHYLALKNTPYELDQSLVTLPMDVLGDGDFYSYIDEQKPDIIHIHSDLQNECFEYCIENYVTVRSVFDWGPFCPRPMFDNAYCPCDPLFKEKRDQEFINRFCIKEGCIKEEDIAAFNKKINLLKRVKMNVCLSEANVNYLVNMGADREKIFKMPPIMKPPKTFEKQAEENVLLFAGRVVYHKGTELLLKSLTKVKNKNWKLFIEGTGDKAYVADLVRFSIVNNIDDKVIFMGHSKYEEYLNVFNKAKIMIFPSIYAEGYGYPGYEAMLRGIPLVAFAEIGGVDEWLRDGYNGIKVPFMDTDKMANAIDSLLDNEALYKKCRDNSIAWSKSIDFEAEIKAMSDMYHNVMKNN
ncbi:glycosyl transferase group 1 [Ruminiclostridium papyrosolvens DSM 2782]|uniref:Glycosyl transferase group 1 n=1 Tax=Ruminiclostridium papyrosolvens DSM 2782 TaxID=588581 RepID=F1T7C0_9FIRM|nr:glycosyltransferase family 4 protein [Ruminiclostridium papyrosolvens]EGD49368.1 glycosyl transferase group 1 [Ruminiclostridium papyrosolvens DSM 2782]WES33505.1 glycosyltransferase family 4 protein [Ruminiclostridium papyrosolvens DSM 2782]